MSLTRPGSQAPVPADGHPVTVRRAMQVIGKYAQVLKISKGGVTLSGGEPQLQRAFVTSPGLVGRLASQPLLAETSY